MRCLEKRPADRPQSAAEVLRALDSLATAPSGTTSPAEAVSVRRDVGSQGSKGFLACAFVGMGIIVGGLAVRWWRGAPSPGTYDVGLSDEAPILFRTGGYSSLTIGPRGDFVVYVSQTRDGNSQLRYRGLLDTVERTIPGTDGANQPRISPDGKSVVFIRRTP